MTKHIHDFEKIRAGFGHYYRCGCGSRLSQDEFIDYLKGQIQQRDDLVGTWKEMHRTGKIVCKDNRGKDGRPVPMDFEEIE